jgi:aspartyl-tRNA(Asn)/glutamyl-tRNA(Gln) amidotransferase subunit A
VASDASDLKELLDTCDEPVLTVMQGEAARANADIIAAQSLDPMLARRLAKGQSVTEAMLWSARSTLEALARDAEAQLFGTAGAVLLPVMPSTTPLVSACEPGSETFSGRTLYGLSSYTRFVNGLGWPAVAFPAGFDETGLPIALQFTGPRGSDVSLVRLVCDLQAATDWHLRRPSPDPSFKELSS